MNRPSYLFTQENLRAPDPQVPLAILHIAASLQQEGFNVRILDMRLKDYRHFKVGNPLFVGISCMSGLQIKYALEFAKQVRTAESISSACLGRCSSDTTTRTNHHATI